jgi:UDP-N-acetylglucosamine diphosphorylase/glucosamine-1-phosphate N-acetyltransferase
VWKAAQMRVCLFEDNVERLEPLSLTRPLFDLVCGLGPLGIKQRRHFNAGEWGALIRPHLVPLARLQHPDSAINNLGWMSSAPLFLVNSRWLPPTTPGPAPHLPCAGMVDGEVAWLFVFPEQLIHLSWDNLAELLELWRNSLPHVPAGGRMLAYPWDLVDASAAAIEQEFAWGFGDKARQFGAMHVVGPEERLWIAPSARIDPLVVADTTSGPVIVAEGAVIAAFTRLEGPCFVGPQSHVLGAKVRGGVTIGPNCRIGGEVEASIVHGHSNKYHEGFLGHSYVGEWVNLAAGTHNSDLRNDYGPVQMMTASSARIDTGRTKVGCFIGDHTKTGLGTLINTGSHIGAFCNLLPAGRLAPRHVPSFTAWWNGSLRESFTLEQLLQTAATAMGRRQRALTAEHITLYEHLHRATALERQRIIDAQQRQTWRKSA